MATESKFTLNNILQSVLSIANQEFNAFYPPYIFNSQFNTVTSLLISSLVKAYPLNPSVIDILAPFVRTEKIPVKNGYVELPKEYRDILGTPSINARPDGKDCDSPEEIKTPQQFQVANNKGGCKKRPVIIVPQSEFDDLTTSTYAYPTLENPIGYFADTVDGVRRIKVCPYDIEKVTIMYVIQEPQFVFTYGVNPDDTYYFDPSNPNLVESVWTSAAFTPILNAMLALYAAFTRDSSIRDWAQVLSQQGIL